MTGRLLAVAYAAFALLAPGRGLPSVCPYRLLTGHRCPFCGLTAAVGAALRGHVRRSAGLHPLGLPVAVLCAAAALRPARPPITGSSREFRVPARSW